MGRRIDLAAWAVSPHAHIVPRRSPRLVTGGGGVRRLSARRGLGGLVDRERQAIARRAQPIKLHT